MTHAIPEIKAMEMQNIKLPQKVQLPNGLPLFLINEGVHEVIRLDMLFKGGYAVQSKPLQALFTNRMLREGSSVLSATDVSRKLDSCGAWIETYSSQNCNHITLYTLRRHLPELLKMLAEIVKKEFDLRPYAIIKTLDLRKPVFKKTAAYGHFGYKGFAWERLDRVDDLKKYL